jgi:hypothetical protein
MSLFGGSSTSRPASKPTKPEPKRQIVVKRLIEKARRTPVVIPGTGGRFLSRRGHAQMLQKYLPHKKISTHLSDAEARIVLRNIRREAYRNPSKRIELNRQRRVLEEEFERSGLKVRGRY